jgi:outer membrane immunogenic protein
MATLRGRFGFLPSENVMIFVSGGLAVTEVDFDHHSNLTITERLTISVDSQISKTETLWGWTFGTGVEWALSERWSFGAEYLHADFGTISATDGFEATGGPVGANTDAEADFSVDVLRAFLNFRL